MPALLFGLLSPLPALPFLAADGPSIPRSHLHDAASFSSHASSSSHVLYSNCECHGPPFHHTDQQIHQKLPNMFHSKVKLQHSHTQNKAMVQVAQTIMTHFLHWYLGHSSSSICLSCLLAGAEEGSDPPTWTPTPPGGSAWPNSPGAHQQ